MTVLAIVFMITVQSAVLAGVSSRSGKSSVEISYAAAGNQGALVRWDVTGGEDVIGYNVYREAGKELVRVSPAMVPGSYVSNAIPGDHGFSFFDRTGTVGAFYRIGIVEIGVGEYFTDGTEAVYDAGLTAPVESGLSVNRDSSPRGLEVKNVPEDHYFSASPSKLFGDPQNQRWVAGQPGVKIRVSADGLYRVSRSELANAGFNVAVPASTWKLYFHGIEQAIIVPTDGSYIEFFGKSLDTPESSQNVYYLIEGAGAGRRMASRVIRRLRSTVGSKSFTSTFERKNRFLYASTILNGPKTNFFGEIISPTATNINFDLPAIDDLSNEAELTLAIQGLTLGTHQIRVLVNGIEYTALDGVNRTESTGLYTLPVSTLLENGNVLTLTSFGPGSDFSLIISIKVRYKRKYKAAGNLLAFRSENYKETVIGGFESDTVRVFDLGQENNPRVVSNASVTEETPGSGTFKAYLPAYRNLDLFAVADEGLLAVDAIEANAPSNLSATTNSANFVIVTNPAFVQEANAWAAYRTSDGFQTMVVNITDVFDEFSYGESTALALTAFFEFAELNWQVDPDYVLLLGDSTYDPRDYEGNGSFNFMPARLVDTLYEETASDDTITDFDGDGQSEMAIGRIPARAAVDVSNALTKVASFESSIGSAPARGSLCASDFTSGYDFQALCGRIHQELPASIPTTEVNRGDSNAKATLLAEINAGKYVVNYSGHGSTGLWASSSFFGIGDVPSLNNTDQSLFTMLTCLNGYFIRPVPDSLSEMLLKSTAGGGVAVWSSSGSTTPDVQEVMAKRFFNQLGIPGNQRLGDLIIDAKGVIVGGADVKRSWVLLGDPALKVKPDATAKSSKAEF